MGIDLIGTLIGVGVNSLQNISGISGHHQATKRDVQQAVEASAKDSFSQILAKLQNAQAGDETESATTLTKALPDGTLVIQKLQGKEVISETRITSKGLQQAQQDLQAMMVQSGQLMQAYIAGMGIAAAPAGAVFNATTV